MATLVTKDTSGIYIPQANEQELVDQRTRAFKKFSLPDAPDGRKRFRVGGQIGPIHYREDPFSKSEQYKEIDLDIQLTPSEEWDAACETNGYQVRFWQSREIGGKTVRYIAQYRRAGKWLAMAPLALVYENKAGQRQLISKALAVGAPTIDNGAYHVTWSDVFGSGIDFRYNLRPDEFFKTVIINNKTDLPAPTINTNGLKLTIVMAMSWHGEAKTANNFVENITTSDLSDDSVDFDNPDEELVNSEKFSFKDLIDRDVWWIQKPKAWDSAEERHDVDVDWRLRRKGNYIFALLSVPATVLNNPETVYPVYIDTDMTEEQVGASSDDARWRASNGAMYLTADYAYITNSSTVDQFGSRFTTIPIQQGATIDSATISYYVNSLVHDDQDVDLCAEDVDDAATFTETVDDLKDRPKTTASVLWSATGIGTEFQSSPDIKTVVQEIISRDGWLSGNALDIIAISTGAAYNCGVATWDYSGNARGAKFNCSYTEAAGGETYVRTFDDSLGVSDAQVLLKTIIRGFDESMGVEDDKTKLAIAIRSIAEALGLTDAMSRLTDYPRTIGDALGLTDTRTKDEFKTLAESIALTDADIALVQGVVRDVVDTLGLTDNLSIGRFAVLAETLGLTDDVESLKRILRAFLDDMGVTDAAGQLAMYVRLVSDSENITDGQTLDTLKTIAESMGVTDAASSILAMLRTLAESEGLTDEKLQTKGIPREILDDVGLTDSASRLVAIARSIADGLGITDSMTRTFVVYRVIAESLGITDEVAADGLAIFIRTINNSIGLTDAQTKLSVIIRAVAESLGLTDIPSQLLVLLRVVSDAEGITDGLVLDRFNVLADNMGLADIASKITTYMKTQDNSIGMTDSVVKLFALIQTVSDNVGMTDSHSKVWLVLRTIDNAMGITDAMDYEGIGAVIKVISDVLGLTDSRTKLHIALRTLAESMGTTDSVSKLFAVSRLVSDAEGITDGIALDRLLTITETLGISDSVSRLVGYLRTQDDGIGVLDAILKVAVTLRTVDDSMGLTDEEIDELSGLVKAAWAFIVIRQTQN